jgi:hypothetical protein
MRSTDWKPRLLAALLLFGGTGSVVSAELDWGALKPGLAGATMTEGTAQCLECHEDYMAAYARTTHGRALTSCDSCHGPSSAHLEKPSSRASQPISFSPEEGLSPNEKGEICLQCHAGAERSYWKGGAHEASDVSCDSCHYVMERRSDHSLAIGENSSATCQSCHLEERA